MQQITITQPDDFHLHIREGDDMAAVLPFSFRQMRRAVIMPNLRVPITTTEKAQKYRADILNALPNGVNFQPLMTLYLTDNTSIDEIIAAKNSGIIVGAKLYPAGATTNSDSGVSDINKIYPVLAKMQELGMILLIHGEVVDKNIDIFDREKIFIDTILSKIYNDFANLAIVFEHITTKEAVDFVLSTNARLAATITPHHLIASRNDMLVGGIRPHYFCLPVLKRKNPHQIALINAAISANKKFFLGTDSAPHTQNNKESACGCAGIFNAHIAIELYAGVFEQYNALDKLEAFSSFFGADFYKLPRNNSKITLIKKPYKIPQSYNMAGNKLIPFMAGETINWQKSTNKK